MIKQRVIRIASLFLVLSMLLFSASATNEIQPRYEKMDFLSAGLEGVSWQGKVTCIGTVSLWDTSCTASLTVELQRSATGFSSWETIASWNQSGDYDIIIEEDWYVTSGYYYRVVSIATVFNANGAFVEVDAIESQILQY